MISVISQLVGDDIFIVMKSRVKFVGLLVLAVSLYGFGFQGKASAHTFDYAAVRTDLNVQGNVISFHSDVPEKIDAYLPEGSQPKEFYQGYLSQNLTIYNDDKPCVFQLTNYTSTEKDVIFDGVFTCPSAVTSLNNTSIRSFAFADSFTAFDHFVTYKLGNDKRDIVFNGTKQQYPDRLLDAKNDEQPKKDVKNQDNSRLTVIIQFLKLGVKHIWTGYDHILFLISVVLLMRSYKKILEVVTSFTVAHTITLMLAGFGVLTISPRIVEPLIALSIIYMAARNVMSLKNKEKDNHIPERLVTTSGFGLIHGLGFAGALTEAGVPKDFFVPSLISFNVGIELGQLAILAVLIPILLKTDKYPKQRKILLILSILIIALAGFWLLQRLFGF